MKRLWCFLFHRFDPGTFGAEPLFTYATYHGIVTRAGWWLFRCRTCGCEWTERDSAS